MAKLAAPRFAYGPDQVSSLALSLPTTAYVKGLMVTAGGDIEGDSGLKAGYVVHDDELLSFSIRFYETEWPDVAAWVDSVMDGQQFLFYPVGDDDTESYFVTLESPAVGSAYNAAPDANYPRVLLLAIVLRAPSFDSPATSIREFEEDFETPQHTVSGASTTRRPDAVSFDYMRAAAPGPTALGDVSLGPTVRKWKVRCLGDTVYIARANPANTDWEAEAPLFTFTNAIADPIVELDFAFTQAGTAVVCAERPSGLWLFWFDPLASGNVFVNLGAGRTPKCVLDQDDPRDPNSDVLVFYINNAAHAADGAICYRVQRERYATEHETPIFGGMTLDVVAGDPDIHPITGDGLSGNTGEEVEGSFTITVPPDLNVNGIITPPYPHSGGDGTLGDWMLADIGLFFYRLVFEFSKPIRNANVSMFYPLDGHPENMFIAAVKDRSQFTGIGGAVYTADDFQSFPSFPLGDAGVGPHDAQVTVNEGFKFLVIDSPLRGAFGQSHYNLSPTFVATFDGNIGGTIELPPIEDMFVEDAVKTVDGRVMVLYSGRDEALGTYMSQKLTSGLYPMFSDADELGMPAGTAVSGVLKIALIIIEPPGTSATQFPDVYAMPDESEMDVAATDMAPGSSLISNLMLVLPQGDAPPPDIPAGRFFFHTIEDLLDVPAGRITGGSLLANVIVVIPAGTSPPANVEATYFDTAGDAGRNLDVIAVTMAAAGNALVTIVITYSSNPAFDNDAPDIFAPNLMSGTLA